MSLGAGAWPVRSGSNPAWSVALCRAGALCVALMLLRGAGATSATPPVTATAGAVSVVNSWTTLHPWSDRTTGTGNYPFASLGSFAVSAMSYYVQTTVSNRNANYVVTAPQTMWILALTDGSGSSPLDVPASKGWWSNCSAALGISEVGRCSQRETHNPEPPRR